MVRKTVEFLDHKVFVTRPEPIIRHVEVVKAFQRVAKKQQLQRFLGWSTF
jgi:hypothetical protein